LFMHNFLVFVFELLILFQLPVYMKNPAGRDSGCLPFTWKFRWFHTESKWNKHISTAQPELFRNKRFVWKGCPLLPIGTFQPVNFVPFTSFLFLTSPRLFAI
jgi:hypothetical protein